MCFKKILLKVSRMYQESLNEVSIKISLHESDRSYPSRRRACLREEKEEITHLSKIDMLGILNFPLSSLFFIPILSDLL